MSFQYQNKKRKIYDVILFNGELNVLGFRLNQLNSFVDYFIIVESEKISYEVNKELFKDFEDKIIYLKIDNDPYYYQLRNFLREILPEFEDIIFISDVGEIPDLTKLDELMEPLKYDSLILNHHHFVWNVDHKTKNLEYGSMMFEYTRIFQNKYLIKALINKKQKPQNFIREIIPNGWKFSFFDNDDEQLFG
jgi:beta-1,4-mannosyl-glycoprotein beta-1,4-N-acetylglucosaminyltransferase